MKTAFTKAKAALMMLAIGIVGVSCSKEGAATEEMQKEGAIVVKSSMPLGEPASEAFNLVAPDGENVGKVEIMDMDRLADIRVTAMSGLMEAPETAALWVVAADGQRAAQLSGFESVPAISGSESMASTYYSQTFPVKSLTAGGAMGYQHFYEVKSPYVLTVVDSDGQVVAQSTLR